MNKNSNNESTKYLTVHNVESYNYFLEKGLRDIVKSYGTTIIKKNKENGKYKTQIRVDLLDDIRTNIPTEKPINCRLNGMTYCNQIVTDVSIFIQNEDEENTIILKDINLCKMPVMLHSKNCKLCNLDKSGLVSEGESPHETGGYFIIQGLEKVLVSQQAMMNNMIYTKLDKLMNKDYIRINIDSVFRGNAVQPFSLRIDPDTKLISAFVPYLKGQVPLIILLRALGLETDKDIVESICGEKDKESSIYPKFSDYIVPNIEDAGEIYGQDLAMRTITILTKERPQENSSKWKENLVNIFRFYLLPHFNTGGDDDYKLSSLKKKAEFICLMARKLILTDMGLLPLSDLDSTLYCKVRLPGELIGEMFREFFLKYISDLHMKISILIESNKKKDNLLQNGKMYGQKLEEIILQPAIKLQQGIDKSFMGKWGVNPNLPRNIGILQDLSRNTFMEYVSYTRRIHQHLKEGGFPEKRRVHSSQWGYFCPIETQDGGSIGTHRHLAHTCKISEEIEFEKVNNWILGRNDNDFIKLEKVPLGKRFRNDISKVFLNGIWIGVHLFPINFVNEFRKERRRNGKIINWSCSISWKVSESEIYIFSTAGRLVRPVRYKDGKKYNHFLDFNKFPLEDCDYIDPLESDSLLIGKQGISLNENTKKSYSHYELGPTVILGMSALTFPFIEHNPLARNQYASQQARQALSVYATNYKFRADQKASILHYGQAPLVHTGVIQKLNQNKLPYGINITIAISTLNGYNQEDAIIINRSAVERGLFVSSHYATYILKEDADTEITDVNSYQKNITNLKSQYDYSLLDENGIIKPGSRIYKNTVLIGAVNKSNINKITDASEIAAKAHYGEVVERVYLSSKKPRVAKIVTRQVRIPVIGDKFASRAAQKAVIGILLPKSDMPYTEDGLVPDIIFNPHSIPSRMTVAYFLEIMSGNLGVLTGSKVSVSPFHGIDFPYKKLKTVIQKYNPELADSEYKLYSGTTGEMICKNACIGSMFYQRLNKMVEDKIYARGANAPRDAITQQPLGGKARGGGLKSGNMERDALISHGMSQFIKEMYYEKSDGFQMAVDTKTGKIKPYNPDANIETPNTVLVNVPFSFKLLLQELYSMGIGTKIWTDCLEEDTYELGDLKKIEKLYPEYESEIKKIYDELDAEFYKINEKDEEEYDENNDDDEDDDGKVGVEESKNFEPFD